jgi:hypothetical protein
MIALGDVVIIGGGCYGTFYTGQLEIARARGAVSYRSLIVVDHNPHCQAAALPPDAARTLLVSDWSAFLDGWFDRAERDHDGLSDMIVPSPMMPHLMAEWLARQVPRYWSKRTGELVPADGALGTPYDRLHGDGVRYVSFADWLCPVHCIEPLRCPIIKAPRTWEMGDAVAAWTSARGAAGPALFTCRHVVHGVGMYPVARAFEGLDLLTTIAERPEGGELVIGSVSACHGAVAVLRVAPRPVLVAGTPAHR